MRNEKVGVFEYGAGNPISVAHAVRRLGLSCEIVSTPGSIQEYSALVLPGVGAFGHAMQNLEQSGLNLMLSEAFRDGTRIVGICLGMQLLMVSSEEGGSKTQGLGFVKGSVKHFSALAGDVRTPVIGWLDVRGKYSESFSKNHKLFFSHSYFCDLEEQDELEVEHAYANGFRYPASFRLKNAFGLQFHPERSGVQGLKILSAVLQGD